MSGPQLRDLGDLREPALGCLDRHRRTDQAADSDDQQPAAVGARGRRGAWQRVRGPRRSQWLPATCPCARGAPDVPFHTYRGSGAACGRRRL